MQPWSSFSLRKISAKFFETDYSSFLRTYASNRTAFTRNLNLFSSVLGRSSIHNHKLETLNIRDKKLSAFKTLDLV
jgi:hypothetical protein